MDLSGLKWPIIIAVIVGIGWLGSGPGINWMIKNFTKAVVGQNAERDKTDEAGLTRVSGYLLMLWKYEKAKNVMEICMNRYGPSAPNYWYNVYRRAKCYEKLGNFQQAYKILKRLESESAEQYHDSVPTNDALRLRAQKLKEVHELQ